MPRFQVPQFIEQKAKIVGPLTLVQFFYIAGAATVSFISYYLFGGFLWFIITLIAGGIGVGLAFININGQPLPKMIASALSFWQHPKQYVWKRETETTTIDTSALEKIAATRRNMSLQQKLKSAALNIATGKLPFLGKGEEQTKKPREQYQAVRYLTGERGVAKRVDYSE